MWVILVFVLKRWIGNGIVFFVKEVDWYWMFNEFGELVIVKISEVGYEEIDWVKVIELFNFVFGCDVVWSMFVFVNCYVYICNDNEIICVDLVK